MRKLWAITPREPGRQLQPSSATNTDFTLKFSKFFTPSLWNLNFCHTSLQYGILPPPLRLLWASRKGGSTTSFGWDHIFGKWVKKNRGLTPLKQGSKVTNRVSQDIKRSNTNQRRGRGAWTKFLKEPKEKGLGADLRCHRAGVVVPGLRAGGRRCWSSTVIRSGSSTSTSNGNSMAHCAWWPRPMQHHFRPSLATRCAGVFSTSVYPLHSSPLPSTSESAFLGCDGRGPGPTPTPPSLLAAGLGDPAVLVRPAVP